MTTSLDRLTPAQDPHEHIEGDASGHTYIVVVSGARHLLTWMSIALQKLLSSISLIQRNMSMNC
jgi:hypothetical protein